jgi:hypothetical protein
MILIKKCFPVLFCFLLTLSAGAEEVKVASHRYPLRLEAKDAVWNLRGSEHFRYKRIFSVFTGVLYLQEQGEGRRLVFTYTRDLKADDLRAQAMKALQAAHAPEVLEKFREPLTGLQAAYQDVKSGDSYAITVIPGRGSWLELNGKELFSTADTDFGFWYLGIWLGDKPISESLKEALLPGEGA